MEEKEQIDGRSLRGDKLYKATHDLLLESAIELLNNPKYDPEKVTLSQIAKNCNLSQAVAYKHFPDRMMDVYGAVVGKRVDEMLEEIGIALLQDKDPIKLLEDMVAIFTNAAIENGNSTRIFFNAQTCASWNFKFSWCLLYLLAVSACDSSLVIC